MDAESKKECIMFLLKQNLEIFKAVGLFEKPEEMFELWMGASNSLISFVLNNVRIIDEVRFNNLKIALCRLLDVLKNEIINT